jgi:hypothetical protein
MTGTGPVEATNVVVPVVELNVENHAIQIKNYYTRTRKAGNLESWIIPGGGKLERNLTRRPTPIRDDL